MRSVSYRSPRMPLAAVLIVLFAAVYANAATFTVTNTNNTGAGSLRQAVTDANAAAGADTIVFDATFNSPQTIVLASVISINGVNDTLTITGPGAALLTISGNNAVRIFATSSGETTNISGITFTQAVTGAIANGGTLNIANCRFTANTNSSGGAIVNSGAALVLTVDASTFSDNTNTAPGVNGAGGSCIYNTGTATITNSTFTNNSTTGGAGGGAIDNRAVMGITGSTFTGNTTTGESQNSRGGAINNQSLGTLTINTSVFTGNSSVRDGGAIYYQPNDTPSGMSITNSTFTGNTSNSNADTTGSGGGAIHIEGTGSVSITGCTINGNSALSGSTGTGQGGGIESEIAVSLTNSTISGNTAARSGGGIYALGGGGAIFQIDGSTIAGNTAAISGGGLVRASATNPVNFRNSIFADNTAPAGPDISGAVISGGYNLIENTTGSTITGDTATNITGLDPMLGPLQNNGGVTQTHALLAGSPAIDKGSSGTLTTDQRQQKRPVDNPSIANAGGGDGSDIGAFEVQPVIQFSSSTYSVLENAGTATITVNRVGGSQGVDSVSFTTSDGTATGGPSCGSGIDYISLSGTVTFNDTEMSKTVLITLCDDGQIKSNETVNLALSTPVGATLGSPTTAVLTIANDDTPTPTPTNTPTATPTNTPTATPTNTPTATPTNTPTATPTNTPTATPTNTPTATPTNTPTATPTNTPTATPTNTPTATPTNTPTATPTNTPTATPTNTPTATPTNTPTATPTNTPTATPTNTPTATPTNTPTATPTNTPTATPTNTPTATPTNTPTATPTNTPTATPTNTPTATPTNTPTATPTNTPTATPTTTPTSTPTVTPTGTPVATSVQFSSSSYIEDESQTAAITITRTGNASGTSVVMFQTASGTATGGAACSAGVDYMIVPPQTLTFGPTETTKTVNVTICADNLVESQENVTLALTGAQVGSPGVATLTINDTATRYRNPAAIDMTLGTPASPYPSNITVTGGPSVVGSLRVTLYDLNHQLPDNIDVLLVGPGGQKFVLLGDAGGVTPVTAQSPVTLTFNDAAMQVLPDSSVLTTGNYEPTTWEPNQSSFPAPAPAGPYNQPGSSVGGSGPQTLTGNFAGTNANGIWSLYVRDDAGVPVAPNALSGSFAGGWGLEFFAPTASGVSISGRVLTANGAGIRNASIKVEGGSLTDPLVAATGSFGYFSIEGLRAGETYVVTVHSIRYTFAVPSRLVTPVDDIADADFVSLP